MGGSSVVAPGCGVPARSLRPIGSSRSAGSATTFGKSPRTTSAASASRTTTTSRKATSSSASFPRRCRESWLLRAGLAASGGPVTQRTDRIDELFRQQIGEILTREVDDPQTGVATITDGETTPDLRHAKVLISVIGSDEERKATITARGGRMPFARHELGKRLRLKRIPQFHLELDETVERGTRILHLLDELDAGRSPDEAPDAETLPTPRPLI